MNPLKFLDPSYLLDTRPGLHFKYSWLYLAIFLALFVSSALVKSLSRLSRHPDITYKFLSPLKGGLQSFAVLGLLWGFFRWQNIPVLAMRLWFVLLILALFIYLIWTCVRVKKQVQKEIKRQREKKRKTKYLPKKKRKKK
jgi:phosphatidylglycerophosphate synthase